MWPGSVEISKQGLDCPKWGGSNSSTISDSNPWHTKDSMTSGWGSVNQSPVPNAGTEGWSTALSQQLQQNNANGSMLPQQLESRSHSNFTSNHPQQPANAVWGTGSGAGPAGAWSRGNPMANSTNQASTSLASNQTLGSGGPSSWAEAVANKQSSNNATSVGLPGGTSTSVSTASSQPTQTAIEETKAKKTQEELIAMAINSNEGWGKTVIRQDTAWIIDDPPAPNEASHKDSHLDHDQHSTATLTSKQIITGTAIWESLKTPQKPAEITTPWETGKTPAVIANGPTSDILSTNQQASFRQTTLDNKVPSVNWPIQASTNSTLTTSTINWGSVATAGGSSSDISWGDTAPAPGVLKKEEERPLWTLTGVSDVGSKSSADLGISPWERNSLPLHRSSSTGSWIEETTTSDIVSGGAVSGGWNEEKSNPSVLHEIDDGTSLWGDPGQNKPQMGWRPGSVLSSKVPAMRKSESEVFNSGAGNPLGLKLGFGADDLSRTWNASLPPPCTESSGWGNSELKENWMGLLNHNQRLKPPFRANNDINDWSALSNNRLLFDKGQPPQRSALLQKLTNMGFKKEEAQAALISNNMNYDEAMTMLLKAKVPGNSLVLDHSLSSSSTPAQGRFNLNSARTLSGGMEDVLGMDNGALDLIGLSNLSINSNSSGINGINSSLVNQLRGSASNAALHQFASSLGNPNLDFSALLTSGPVIPQLQTPKPLAPLVSQQHSRPMPSLPPQQSPIMQQFIQCVQSAVQLGLLPPQAINQHSLSNPNFCNNLQMLLKLYESQKLLLQTIQQGPPPGHNSSSVLCQQQQQHQIYECTAMQQHIDTLKQQLVQMAGTASNSVSAPLTSSSVAPSSRLISQWKVSDGGSNSSAINSSNDVNRLQHSTSLLEQSDSTATSSTWLPMASTSTSSWLGGDVSASNGNAPNEQKSSLASSTVTTTTSAQTSSLSEANSASAAIAALDIEEFVPGKPWQGPGTKNVEDDPYLTPGSITRNSISSVKDSQVASILGKANYPSLSCTSGSINNTSSNNLLEQRAQGSFSSKMGSQWVVPDSKPSDLWPGQSFNNKSGMGQWNPVNRSISWASGDRADNISSSTTAMSNNWSMSSPPSNWLLIKSIPQVDTINLQNLCHQYGTITSFIPNLCQGQSLVLYARAEDALKAYRGMNAYRLGKADFISDAEVAQAVNKIQQQQQQLATPASGFQQANNGMMGAVGGSGLMGNGGMLGNGQAFFGKLPLSVPPGGDPSLLASLRAPPHWGTGLSGGGMMGLWNNATSPGGQQSLWGGGIGLEDHDHNVFLPGDLLGNQ